MNLSTGQVDVGSCSDQYINYICLANLAGNKNWAEAILKKKQTSS